MIALGRLIFPYQQIPSHTYVTFLHLVSDQLAYCAVTELNAPCFRPTCSSLLGLHNIINFANNLIFQLERVNFLFCFVFWKLEHHSGLSLSLALMVNQFPVSWRSVTSATFLIRLSLGLLEQLHSQSLCLQFSHTNFPISSPYSNHDDLSKVHICCCLASAYNLSLVPSSLKIKKQTPLAA